MRVLQVTGVVTFASIAAACWILLRPPARPKFPNYPVENLERMASVLGLFPSRAVPIRCLLVRTAQQEDRV